MKFLVCTEKWPACNHTSIVKLASWIHINPHHVVLCEICKNLIGKFEHLKGICWIKLL